MTLMPLPAANVRHFDGADQPRREDARTDKQADPDLVYAAMAVIPNDDVEWNGWNDMGMAMLARHQRSRARL